MVRILYLALCKDPNHEKDEEIVKILRGIEGIKEVHVREGFEFNGQEYCIIAEADVESAETLERIRTEIQEKGGLEYIITLRPKEEETQIA